MRSARNSGSGSPRDARDQYALDVGAGVIEPRLAGLAEHRDLGERPEPFVRRFSRPKHRELLEELDNRRQREVRGKAPAAAEGQDVLDGDRACRRYDVVDRALKRPHDLRRRQLGQPPRDRVIERHQPLVHKDHDCCCSDGLRDRGDPGDRLRLDLAHAGDLDVLTTRNECSGARHPAALNGSLQQGPQGRHRGTDPVSGGNSSQPRR
jgi:hypothetical protein